MSDIKVDYIVIMILILQPDIAFSPDNMHLAITGADGQLRIIDYRNERLVLLMVCQNIVI